jgi:histidinol-phosphate aminotransferase
MQIRRTIRNMTPYVAGERRPGLLKLSSNENPLGPSPRGMEAVQTALSEAHIYPDGSMGTLRRAIAEARGVTPDMIIPGNGSDEVMTMVAGTYLDPGDRVVIGAHTFSQYAFAARLFDAEITVVPMPGLAMKPRDILAAAAGDTSNSGSRGVGPAKIVFICTPNNPTGLALSRNELEEIMQGVSPETLVVVDHAYQEYATSPDVADASRLLDRYPNIIALHTFSKIYGLAATRVGYGMASPDLIRDIDRVRLPFNINSLAQAAAIAALEDSDFVTRSLETNRTGKARMEALLTELELAWLPTEGNFICVDVGMEAKKAAEVIAENGVTVRGLSSFGLPRHVRITVGTDPQIDVLERGLRALAGRTAVAG